jgi:hypothetical protein
MSGSSSSTLSGENGGGGGMNSYSSSGMSSSSASGINSQSNSGSGSGIPNNNDPDGVPQIDDKNTVLSDGAIFGIVIGAVVFIVLSYLVYNWKNKKSEVGRKLLDDEESNFYALSDLRRN